MPIVKLKKANFFRAFGKTINLVRPVAEFTEDEIAKIENDIKSGNIEVVYEKAEVENGIAKYVVENKAVVEAVVEEAVVEDAVVVEVAKEVVVEEVVEELENVKPSKKSKAK